MIADGTIYFAASIWPFMGVFLHALDARTGTVIWTNDGDGSIYMKQPHNADSFAGIAPQGPLVVAGDTLAGPRRPFGAGLLRPQDRQAALLPAGENAKRGGGSDVAVIDRLVFNGGAIFELDTGSYLGTFSKLPVLGEDVVYGFANGKYRAFDLKKSPIELTDATDRKGVAYKTSKCTMADLGSFDAPKVEALIRAGSRLYAGSPDQIAAVELPLHAAGSGDPRQRRWMCPGRPKSRDAGQPDGRRRSPVRRHAGGPHLLLRRRTRLTPKTHKLDAPPPAPGSTPGRSRPG